MKKIKSIGLGLLALVVFYPLYAQFQYEKTITPQAVRESMQFIAIAVSEFDDIYLIENKYSEVYRLSHDGSILNRNGGFGWGLGQFDHPSDLCTSGLDIIVADRNNHRIVRYDRKLNYIATHDLRSASRALIYPMSLATGHINEVFILSSETAEVMRLYIEKNEQTWFGGLDYGSYALCSPVSLRLSEKGILTVLQQDGSLVQFDRYGTPLSIIPFPDKQNTKAIALIPVRENWLVLTDKTPFVQVFSNESKTWFTPLLSGYLPQIPLVAAAYKNDRLYLLTSAGEIVVLGDNRYRSKP